MSTPKLSFIVVAYDMQREVYLESLDNPFYFGAVYSSSKQALIESVKELKS